MWHRIYTLAVAVVALAAVPPVTAQPVPERTYRTIQSAKLTATNRVQTWESQAFKPPKRLYVHVYRLRGDKAQRSTERFIGRCAAHHIVGGIFVRVAQRSVRGGGCNQRTRQTIRLRYVSVTGKQRFLVRVTTRPFG